MKYFIAVVAGMMCLVLSGLATAACPPICPLYGSYQGMSCDLNQAQTCSGTPGDHYCVMPDSGLWPHEILLVCNQMDHECVFPFDAGCYDRAYVTNNVSVATWNPVACGSGYEDPFNNRCCAMPGDAVLQDGGPSRGFGYTGEFCEETIKAACFTWPCPADTSGIYSNCDPANMGPAPGVGFPLSGGGPQCNGQWLWTGAGPNAVWGTVCDSMQDGLDFVDAGNNIYAQHGLMKTRLDMVDSGVVRYLPLGFFGNCETMFGWGSEPGGPQSVVQMPWYLPDGGWLLANLPSDAGPVDLIECGPAQTDNAWTASDGVFPCAGSGIDAGAMPNICTPDSNGINHCQCIQDGFRCDVPGGSWAHTSGIPPIPYECCSPGLLAQISWPGEYDGDAGWCRPSGNAGSLSSWNAGQPGWCNCLPTAVACDVTSSCCGYQYNMGGMGATVCGSGSACEYCSGATQDCITSADCCAHLSCNSTTHKCQ